MHALSVFEGGGAWVRQTRANTSWPHHMACCMTCGTQRRTACLHHAQVAAKTVGAGGAPMGEGIRRVLEVMVPLTAKPALKVGGNRDTGTGCVCPCFLTLGRVGRCCQNWLQWGLLLPG